MFLSQKAVLLMVLVVVDCFKVYKFIYNHYWTMMKGMHNWVSLLSPRRWRYSFVLVLSVHSYKCIRVNIDICILSSFWCVCGVESFIKMCAGLLILLCALLHRYLLPLLMMPLIIDHRLVQKWTFGKLTIIRLSSSIVLLILLSVLWLIMSTLLIMIYLGKSSEGSVFSFHHNSMIVGVQHIKLQHSHYRG